MAIPDQEQVSWFLRILKEIKDTPSEVILGFIGFGTVILKFAGKLVKKEVEVNPRVTRSEMETCRDDMVEHMDNGLGDLKSDIKDLDDRIDGIYTLMAQKGK